MNDCISPCIGICFRSGKLSFDGLFALAVGRISGIDNGDFSGLVNAVIIDLDIQL
jgi:hypothetical protein